MKRCEIEHTLARMGFADNQNRALLTNACILYAGGMHQLQDILAKISENTGFPAENLRDRMNRAVVAAWCNHGCLAPEEFPTRFRPSLKKFIKAFVETRMEGEQCSKTE